MNITMSDKERDRLGTMQNLVAGELSQRQAAKLLSISPRQVRRVLQRYRNEGDVGLVHKSRGQPSSHRFPDEFREQVMDLVREHYHDFGPTFAAEKLAQRDGLHLSKETLRKWMIEDALHKSKSRRTPHRTWRPPRECCGEMLQIDGSIHAWFEDRGPKVVLMSAIDDATKRLHSRFAPAESTEAAMELLAGYIARYGRPLAIYADRHSIYKTTRSASVDEQLEGQEPETQFNRALRELDIEYIPSYSPQGKGRVERSFLTCQDRLILDMRLVGISDIEAANEFLERVYLPQHNSSFTEPPACAADAHRSADGFDLAAILSHQETRAVTNDYTISYHNVRYQIAKASALTGLRGSKVIVERRLDGSVHVRFRERYLTVSKLPAAQPDAAVDQRRKRVVRREPTVVIPGPDHPWRRDYREMADGPMYP
jgi:transposase